MKWVIERNDGGVWGDDPLGEGDTLVLRSTEQTVDGRWQIEEPALRSLSEKEKLGSLLETGDLLVTKSSGSALHIGKTTLVTPEIAALGCCYSNFMQRLRLKPVFDSKLAWYLMNNEIARTQFDLLSNSTTGLANLNGTMLGELVVPLPSRDEQAAIATFLDHETAKIDALVAEQERLINLLKEKRQAVISHAVTKGLDPSVPMKESGVEWLGEVPAHWAVSRLKNISPEITVGVVVEPSKYYSDDGVPALRSLNVGPMEIRQDGYVYFSPESNDLLAKSKLQAGDLVAVRSGQPGTTAVIPEELAGCNCIDLIIIRKPLNDDARYMAWYLNSDAAVRQFTEGSGGAIQQHFNVGTAMNLLLTRPPIEEQTRIVSALEAQVQELDQLIAEGVLSIELLQERRTALISAAVTGQIDVRGWVPAEAVA
jgi:type I restriction enzyme S subunit